MGGVYGRDETRNEMFFFFLIGLCLSADEIYFSVLRNLSDLEREFNKKKDKKVAVLLQFAEQIEEAGAARAHAATTSPATAVVTKKQMKKKFAQVNPCDFISKQ
jgi:hypothetical protein